jgi:hypothetical protein
MYFLPFLLLFKLITKYPKIYNIPDCKNCIYYTLTKQGDSLCKKYGEKEDITGKIIFYETSKCREDVFRCGENGKYFSEKNVK